MAVPGRVPCPRRSAKEVHEELRLRKRQTDRTDPPVVIVGGGPIGLAAAMLLARDGHEIVVLEKDPEPPPASALEAWESWERGGVAQFRQLHVMLPRFRHLLDAELPAVRDEIEANGGTRFNFIDTLPPSIEDRTPRGGDERFETVTARRPVLETAFARVAEASPGVTIRRGVAVSGPIIGPSREGVPHVVGVRTTGGEEIHASVVVDAMGRRSKLPQWVVAAGGQPPFEEALDAGFAYYTRHFRSRGGTRPEILGPLSSNLDTLRVVAAPADNNTWTIVVVAIAGDKPFKALRHNHVWERVVGAIPKIAHLLDGESLCDVLPMAGVMDRYRRIVVDGHPVVTGILPVGDSWACTNPRAGRGITLGLAQAIALRDSVRADLDDPVGLAQRYDRVTEESLTPYYRQQVDADRQSAAQIRARIAGEPVPTEDDPRQKMQAAFFAAAAVDPVVARAVLEVFSCLTLPAELMARPGMAERVAPFLGSAPPLTPGPTRDNLLALVS